MKKSTVKRALPTTCSGLGSLGGRSRGGPGAGKGGHAKEKAAYESCAAGLAAYGGGHRAQRAQRGGAGAALQGRGRRHHLANRGLGLGRRRGGEADLGHLVHRGKQPVLGLALEIPAEGKASRGEQELTPLHMHWAHGEL